MSDLISGGKIDKAINVALTGLSTRQKVISNNLANIDTPGFKASTVSFEEQLRRSLGTDEVSSVRLATTNPNHIAEGGSSPGTVAPQIEVRDETVMRNDKNSVDVDKEMVQLADTAISYNTLIQVETARLSIARYIVNDGRR